MAYITGSVTDSLGTLPFSLSAGTQLTMSIQNTLAGASYYGLETFPDQNGFYATAPKNLSGSFILGSGITDVVYDDYKMVAVVQPGGGTLTYTPAVDIDANTLRTKGTGAYLGQADFATLAASSYSKRVTEAGGYVESPNSITAAITATPILKDASFLYIPSGYASGTAFSELSTNDYGDLTWSRASDGTRTNSEGLVQRVPWNLLQYSEDFSSGVWGKQNITINTNTTISPNGTLTAEQIFDDTSSNWHRILYTISPTSGNSYTYSIYLKANTETVVQLNTYNIYASNSFNYANFDLQNGVIGTYAECTPSITNVGNGWYRCSITQTSVVTGTSYIYVTFANNDPSSASRPVYSGTGNSFYLWGAQLVEGTSPQSYLPTTTRLNVPRLDYTYGTSPASLMEPQRTNSILYSEAINSWSNSGLTITDNNTLSPRGTQDASYIQQTTGGNIVSLVGNNISVSSSQAQCVTFYAKPKEVTTLSLRLGGTSLWVGGSRPTFTLDLTSGTSSSVSNCTVTSINVGNGWYRYTIQTAATVAGGLTSLQTSATYVLSSNSGDGFYLWGVQWEQNANYPTTYIPTTSATATRVADSFSRSNIYTNGLISASGGTWFVELRGNVAYTRDSSLVGLFLGDTSTGLTSSFAISCPTGNDRLRIGKFFGGYTQLFQTTTDTVKIAIKWNGSTADIFVNGTKQVSATAFTATALEFLAHSTSVDVPKYIQAMALYNQPLAGVDMGVLTGASYYPSFLNMAQANNYTIA